MTTLACTSKQLNLGVVLLNGQSFRWKKLPISQDGSSSSQDVFVGVAKHKAWKIWRKNEGEIEFKVLVDFNDAAKKNRSSGDLTKNSYSGLNEAKPSDGKSENQHILEEYFQLDINVEELYRNWSTRDEHFCNQLKLSSCGLEGIRILRQDPLETLFSFICSANNNISRISSTGVAKWCTLEMVERMCELYGTACDYEDVQQVQTFKFFDFPNLNQLEKCLPEMEQQLRKSGFGYRAAYIAGTVRKLTKENLDGENWLNSLSEMTYSEMRQQLSQLPGVGPKVADCVCLMGLQKHEVVPVDTHVYQITAQFYLPEYLKNPKKAVSKKMHEDIGRFYIQRFGPYAGWAHSVLFSARLKAFH